MALCKYCHSLNSPQVSVEELERVLFSKFNKLIEVNKRARVKKLTNTLYMEYFRVDCYPEYTEDVCVFYETVYDFIIMVSITQEDSYYGIYYLSENGKLVFAHADFNLFSENLTEQIREKFLQEADVGQIPQYYFDKFVEKYPIVIPSLYPHLHENVAKCFFVLDQNIAGIQELPVELEDV